MSRPIIETIEPAVVAEMQKLRIDLKRKGQHVHEIALLNVAKRNVHERSIVGRPGHHVQLVNTPFADLLKGV